ncbi:Non-hemolytic phospholipase C precursor [Achromobacter insolitus]|uniref:phosphocholine-specific phospholipase C n=1 Tax=Achromobacter insolitus TaxID=217204 RepID=UPI0009726D85|nr:phospholipase C, phosphocholine-specific [Achromobacter insolitus]APX76718.1 phospholipase C, phosphocholine-specific [Achromobacter insolitus]OWT64852.1 phospholipase C, phosphocholine-specific [Achromobacter insolitus]CAB3720024.1 Non-hemolytic phospholipase C [Achromobacter insolitus]VEG71057.1 Non-hemolytic phospholipase C precursor [Achromobacter insolitus]
MQTRRDFLRNSAALAGAGSALALFPAAIRRALAIPANHRTGTIRDVEHIVIFMQENRSFDHYFGALAGVRGFGDRFPIPVPDSPDARHRSVWAQYNDKPDDGQPRTVLPFHLDTREAFETMRVASTPHTWSNAQDAWDAGRMGNWPAAKKNHSMAYFTAEDMPFQYAMARAFTVCDAYHCSFTGGTNTNRLFVWTGTNDGLGRGNGPALGNTYNKLTGGDPARAYTWTTYPERLEAAGVSWRIYQNMADNYSLNPTAGFKAYRDAYHGVLGSAAALKDKALTTRDLDLLRQDVLDGTLPQVSWICATKAGSEHPSPSSPAQGADYTARVLDALTADPEVWSKTVLLLMFDENDGFFDHMPPPAPPSRDASGALAGASTVDTRGEYHEIVAGAEKDDTLAHLHGVYGLGPRVPMYVLSPWTKGGWVNSQVFDHTSVLRFVEQRFGVAEPNISPWRRAVCGDLTSIFDFSAPDGAGLPSGLPATAERAGLASALPGTITPPAPRQPALARQSAGTRPSRPLPYALQVHARVDDGGVALRFENIGTAGAVFHVYDRLHLAQGPRRYTVEAGTQLEGTWHTASDDGRYDLWILGPNGFHRHCTGRAGAPPLEVTAAYQGPGASLQLTVQNPAPQARSFQVQANAYGYPQASDTKLGPGESVSLSWDMTRSGGWYDVTVLDGGDPAYTRRLAGRIETGAPSTSDPAMGQELILQWTPLA